MSCRGLAVRWALCCVSCTLHYSGRCWTTAQATHHANVSTFCRGGQGARYICETRLSTGSPWGITSRMEGGKCASASRLRALLLSSLCNTAGKPGGWLVQHGSFHLINEPLPPPGCSNVSLSIVCAEILSCIPKLMY